jgi:hypothetical protein
MTPEQALAVGKILHPNWTFTEKFTGTLIDGKPVMTVHYMHPGAQRGSPRFYDPTTPAECWAMVIWLLENHFNVSMGIVNIPEQPGSKWVVSGWMDGPGEEESEGADVVEALIARVLSYGGGQ